MFVLELTYTVPVDAVDVALDAHIRWLDEQYAAGVFLASGRKNPRDGGVILAVGDDRARIETVVAADPYVTAGFCAYRITEFAMTKTVPELAAYQEPQRP
ncbi:YciI family protein [Streptomyces uncialis]|uniref:YciI family protein n=1 Tax=Streptomyces uncialis TaxID=1048205 RepID=UPI002E33398A|nr:YciI family protein [Streptomyces uncialis]